MFTNYKKLPTGLSVSQAKKDAKRLAKESNIPLSKALDQIAFKHSRSDWATAMNQLKTLDKLSVILRQDDGEMLHLDFSGRNALMKIIGQSGSGKSVLALEFASQFLASGIPVVYLGADISEMYHAGIATNNLAKKYPNLFTAITIDELIRTVSIDEITLNGAVLIIDETSIFSSRSEYGVSTGKILDLINTSMKTILAAQVLSDMEPLLNDSLDLNNKNNIVVALPSSYYCDPDLPYISEVSELKKEKNKHIELIWAKNGEIQKLRFELASHSAL